MSRLKRQKRIITMGIQPKELHINDTERRFPMHDTKKKLTTNAGVPAPDNKIVS